MAENKTNKEDDVIYNAPNSIHSNAPNPARPLTTGREETSPATNTTGSAGDGRNIAGTNPSATHPGAQGGGKVKSFRCADVGPADCRWEVSGRTEDELMPQIERHGREAHNINNIDSNMKSKIHNSIRERQAA